jgi:hypothetical protein
MIDSRMFVVCVLVLAACGGQSAEATSAAPDAAPPSVSADASSPSLEALYQQLYPFPVLPYTAADGGLPDTLAAQCFPRPMPLASDGQPNCIVVVARPENDQQVAACERCTDPGLEPLVTSISLDRIGEGLSNFDCVCAVRALPSDSGCSNWGALGGWCYAGPPDAGDPGPCSMGGIRFPPVPAGSTTYVACFEPGVNR